MKNTASVTVAIMTAMIDPLDMSIIEELGTEFFKQETQMTPEQIKAEKLKKKEERKKLAAKEKLEASRKTYNKKKSQIKAAAKERTQLYQDIEEKGSVRWFQDNGGIGPALRSPLLKVAGFKKAFQVAQKQAKEAAEAKRENVGLGNVAMTADKAPMEAEGVTYPVDQKIEEIPVLTDGASR
jgi:hypothetical protein